MVLIQNNPVFSIRNRFKQLIQIRVFCPQFLHLHIRNAFTFGDVSVKINRPVPENPGSSQADGSHSQNQYKRQNCAHKPFFLHNFSLLYLNREGRNRLMDPLFQIRRRRFVHLLQIIL